MFNLLFGITLMMNLVKINVVGKLELLSTVLIHIMRDSLPNKILLVKLDCVLALALTVLDGYIVSLPIKVWK